MQYAPWALFNCLNPLVAIGYALTGFRVERLDADGADEPRPSAEPRAAAATQPSVT